MRNIAVVGLSGSMLLLACGEASVVSDSGIDSDLAVPPDTGVALDMGPADGGAPDLGVESCAEEGATRTRACGNCGLLSQTCVAGGWTDDSECIGEGECAAGEVERETNGMCLDRARICMDSCAWGDWDESTPEGECTPGDTRQDTSRCALVGEYIEQSCSDECAWEDAPDSSCVSPCGSDLVRTGLLQEVCVPGADVRLAPQPGAPFVTASVSTFRIMRYAATRESYLDCVGDGVCPGADLVNRREALQPTPPQVPTSGALSNRSAGQAYCAWLGGRLPTLAEWVLAGRGPAPRENDYPWWNGVSGAGSNDAYGCDTVPSDVDRDCMDRWPDVTDPVDAFPDTASYYGVEGMVGIWRGFSWLLDRWVEDADFAAVYTGLDPVGAGDDGYLMVFTPYDRPELTLDTRSRGTSTTAGNGEFRCVKEVP